MLHLFEPLHLGQVLGEPWLASVVTTINQEAELVRTELAAAKLTSAMAFVIVSNALNGTPGGGFGLGETTEQGDTTPAPNDGKGNVEFNINTGGTFALNEGEDVKAFSSTRPSQQIAPFRQMLRGDMAAALRIRQSDLDKDYSKANYTSMRAAQLDLRRSIEPVQNRAGGQCVAPLWKIALPALILAAGVNAPRTAAEWRRWRRVQIMPDGFPYVNPKEDIEAAALAIRSGFSTWADELGWRGKDPRRVHRILAQELKNPLLAQIFAAAPAGGQPMANTEKPEPETPQKPTADDERSRMEREQFQALMQRIETLQHAQQRGPGVTVEQRISMDEPTAQLMGAAIGRSIPTAPAPQIHNTVQPAPVNIVNEVRAEAAPVQQIVVHATAPTVQNNITTPEPVVNNYNTVEVPQRTVRAQPQPDGSVLMTPVEK
jgi:hypothetical protein